MQIDFHYYATYCAAWLAGFNHRESLEICYAAQMVDCCSASLLRKLDLSVTAATTQLQGEMVGMRTDIIGLQEITRIWASFHFLPYDLKAEVPVGSVLYRCKRRLICRPNSRLMVETVKLAKGKSLAAVGIAMHVLADTWAHAYFAGTPSFVINNTDFHFYELLPENGEWKKRKIHFNNNPASKDDPVRGNYTNSLEQSEENTVMNLGHGRAGHLPDYSFMRYQYVPAWGNYVQITKDNPSEYYHAFCQMVQAMRFLRGEEPAFDVEQYATEQVEPWKNQIMEILERRQLDSSEDWKALGQRLSGEAIPPFDLNLCQNQYLSAPPEGRKNTFLGQFIPAALAQKGMVTTSIFESGSLLAGFPAYSRKEGLFRKLKRLIELLKTERGEERR